MNKVEAADTEGLSVGCGEFSASRNVSVHGMDVWAKTLSSKSNPFLGKRLDAARR
jgi:hypothetical protein